MKSLKTLLLLILSVTIYAQSPMGFSFQTIIRDAEGKVQKNQAVKLRFSILQGSESGSSVYSETHAKTTNEYGVINLTVGTGTPVSGSFSSIVWGSNIHFLKTEIDPSGGSSYTISSTSQLMSVPYAMYASQADTTFKTNVPNGTNTGDILYWNGTKWDRLQNGNPGDILRVNSNNEPYWANQQTLDLPDYVPADGLVGYWPFNGNANDESGNGNHGTVNGATLTEDRFGNANSAFLFEKSIPGQNISTDLKGILNNNNRSISLWFKSFENEHFENLQVLCGYGITNMPNSEFAPSLFKYRPGISINNTTIFYSPNSFGKWNNYTLTFDKMDGGDIYSIKIYLNGVLLNEVFHSSSLPGQINTLLGKYFTIGSYSDLPIYYQYAGLIDDIGVWNRPLSDQEILNLYSQNAELVEDIDGNIYKTVKIGNQVWFPENLKTTKFRGGTLIPNVTDNNEWINLSTPARCNYNNDIGNDFIYGKLYNWFTVDGDSLCPTGWHVPSDVEWTVLIDYLGGESVAGGKLKETGNTLWKSPNEGATNETGFTALPSGKRNQNYGTFDDISTNEYWWSTKETSLSGACGLLLHYNFGNVQTYCPNKKSGLSIRCLKD